MGARIRLLCTNGWGLVALLTLSFINRNTSRFGDAKQICFAEAFCRGRISPLMRYWWLLPFLVPSPNTRCVILQIPCWPHSTETIQSLSQLSLSTEGLKKVVPPIPCQPKCLAHCKEMLHTLHNAKYLKAKKRIRHVTLLSVIEYKDRVRKVYTETFLAF